MNEIKVTVNFKRRKIITTGVDLTSGDYNSTKLVFDFDTEEGTKIFEMNNPNGVLIYAKEIINNEVPLYVLDENEQKSSLFNQAGEYQFEVSLYNGDSKLTSATSFLNVEQETVIIGEEKVEAYLPVFDDLMNDIETAITETNNLDLDATKVGDTATLSITNKEGITKTIEIYDGDTGATGPKGDKGDKGDTGSQGPQGIAGKDAKINGVNTLSIEAGTNIDLEQEGNTLTINCNESDPTVPNYVKSITQDNISSWNNKQNKINDLDNIRSGASAGLTAVQPNDLATVATTGNYMDLLNLPDSVYATPEMYGAVGDGVTDDTVAINACIAENDTIVFDKIYAISTASFGTEFEKHGVTVPSNKKLVFLPESELRCIHNVENYYTGIYIYEADNVTIYGMKLYCDRSAEIDPNIKHPSDNGMGVRIIGSSNISLIDCEVSNCLGDCVSIWVSGNEYVEGEYTICQNILINNCKIYNARRNGITIGASKNVMIKDCEIYDNGKDVEYEGGVIGHAVNPKAGVDIEPNYVHNIVDNVIFENCYFHGNVNYDVCDNRNSSWTSSTHSRIKLINCICETHAWMSNADFIIDGGEYEFVTIGKLPNSAIISNAILHKILSGSIGKTKLSINNCHIIGHYGVPNAVSTMQTDGAGAYIVLKDCIIRDCVENITYKLGHILMENCYVDQQAGRWLQVNNGGHIEAKNTEFHFENNTSTKAIWAYSMAFTNCDFYTSENKSEFLFVNDNTISNTWYFNRFHTSLNGFSPKSNNLVMNWFNFASTQLDGSFTGTRTGNMWTDMKEFLTEHQDISGKLDTSKVKNANSTIAGDVYDVRYINTMLGDVESLLGGI